MGFSVDDLKNSLLIMFQTQSNPNTMEQHFKDLAKIYDDYCKDAMDNIASNTLFWVPAPNLSGATTILALL